MRLTKSLGVLFIIVLSLIPLYLWWPYANFSTPASLFRSLGQATGLVGSTLLSLNFILSARLKVLEPIFDGLNRIYIVHHLIGIIAFLFLLTHPLMLLFQFLPQSIFSATRFILFPVQHSLPAWAGVAAFILLTLLLFVTLYAQLKYFQWRFTHQFMGTVLLLASLHIYFIPSTTGYDLPLRIFMLSLIGLGLAAFSYRVLLTRYLVKTLLFEVTSVTSLSSQIVELLLSPRGPTFRHLPGQFVFLSFQSPAVSSEVHPFSLTNPPGTTAISFAIKSSGDFTSTLKRLSPGSLAHLEGPFGRFSYTNSYSFQHIWIAGGIGITPFISMARSLTPTSPYRVSLFYSVSSKSEAIYTSELAAISRNLPAVFSFVLHVSDSSSHLTASTIVKQIPDFRSRDIFVCGPPPMMASLKSQFLSLGAKKHLLHSEEFALN